MLQSTLSLMIFTIFESSVSLLIFYSTAHVLAGEPRCIVTEMVCKLLILCLPVVNNDDDHDHDDDMGSPIFSSTHVASNYVLGKLSVCKNL